LGEEPAMRVRQVAGSIMVMALAGCGTATAPSATGHVAVTGHWDVIEQRGGAPAATRAESLWLAGRLLDRNVLPSGARRLPHRPLPVWLRQVSHPLGVTSMVDVYRLYTLPVSLPAAAAFLAGHSPAGMTSQGTGSGSVRGAVFEQDVTYVVNKPQRGISSAQLQDTMVSAPHGGSILRTDAQVIWYPLRSAAEYLNVKDYRAVTIDTVLYSRSDQFIGKPVTRTFTARGVIARLARFVNRLPASPAGGLVFSCREQGGGQLTFEPVAGRPKVVVYDTGCGFDTVFVGGARQPALIADSFTQLLDKIVRS
jgi:hypothetical protein